jgi:hypothetical protein
MSDHSDESELRAGAIYSDMVPSCCKPGKRARLGGHALYGDYAKDPGL